MISQIAHTVGLFRFRRPFRASSLAPFSGLEVKIHCLITYTAIFEVQRRILWRFLFGISESISGSSMDGRRSIPVDVRLWMTADNLF